jgi:radical SAM protein with 4Fe4S-binding SPASM domain
MSETLANRIMDEVIASEVLSVCLTGGEPLTNYKVIKLILERCKEVGIHATMNSNATLLNENNLHEIQELGLAGIFTSVLGSCPEIHDVITGVVESFEKTIAGIRLCLQSALWIDVNMVVNKKNFADILSTAKMLESIGCSSMHIDTASCPVNCDDFSEFDLSHNEKIQALRSIDNVNCNTRMLIGNSTRVPYCLIPQLSDQIKYFTSGCSAGTAHLVIGSNGECRACAKEIAMYKQSIRDSSLIDIWEDFSSWQTEERIPDECKECKLLYKCGGGCRFAGSSATGKINGCDPLMDKAGVEKALEMFGIYQQDIQCHILPDAKINFSNFSIRNEEFGAVIWNGNAKQFVNESGRLFLRNIVPGKSYLLGNNISENYKEFLTDLVIGGFANVS